LFSPLRAKAIPLKALPPVRAISPHTLHTIKLMNADNLVKLVVNTLDDGKGRDITVVDVRGKTSMTDFMVVASGTSERHVKSLAGHVAEEAKKNETQPIGVDGEDVGEWVLVDLGEVIVHVMKPQIRDFYQLEKLWRGESGPVETIPALSVH
jgi:ribosome-associated protein